MGAFSSREAPYTVVVTGCSSGIGEATALALDGAGFNVLAGVRKQADADRITARGSPRLHPIILDVTNDQHVRELPAKVAAVAKGGRVGLVCNAGIALLGPVETMPMEDFRKLFDVNVFGLLAVTKALLPTIRETKGRVALVGSVAGIMSVAFGGGYSATKFAVEAIGDSLRRELAPFGAHVSIIEPVPAARPRGPAAREPPQGFIKTGITEEKFVRKSAARSGPYEDGLRRSWALMRFFTGSASPASRIAEHILDAMTSPSPKDRYRDGAQSSSMTCLACLPVACTDSMTASSLGFFDPYKG